MAIKNGQSRDIGNIGYTRHKKKTKPPKNTKKRKIPQHTYGSSKRKMPSDGRGISDYSDPTKSMTIDCN